MIASLRKPLLGLGLALVTSWSASASDAQAFHGSTLVVDGDTLMVGSQRVRLWGIDAPEGVQQCQDGAGRAFACGDQARDALRSLIAGGVVTCVAKDRDPYGRTVAQCTARGIDLNSAMVRAGWAVDYAAFSHGAYAGEQAAAQAEHAGIWSGKFERPADFRRREREADNAPRIVAAPSSTDSGSGCRIKGNISRGGERIYHLPGERDYAATHISERRGERWFCSEAQARAAGWRAPR